MELNPKVIIAINPGTRYLGLAIFSDTELCEARVKGIKGVWSNSKLKHILQIITRYLNIYHPGVLAIKKLHPARASGHLNSLFQAILDLANSNRMKVYQYSIKDLKTYFCPEKRINKKKLAEMMAAIYPHLFPELNMELGHRNPYYTRMFEAVALGNRCQHHIEHLNINHHKHYAKQN